jgi:hypothetical protein
MSFDSEALRNHFGNWGNHSSYPHEEWQLEVAADDTRLGYWEWVAAQLRQEVTDFVATLDSVTAEDVDRLLGLGDQFLEDWAVDAVQNGKRDSEYEQRMEEWRRTRPLLAGAPKLLKALTAVIEAGRTSQEPRALYCAEIAWNALAQIVTAIVPQP